MIGYIKGRVLFQSDNQVTLMVGPNEESGVGYSVFVPQSVAYRELREGQRVSFWIHTHVREDALDLYGFLTSTEKEFFLGLTSVNGIGPKLAITVLGHASPAMLESAIESEDRDALTGIPGVGKKTVERLLIELRDWIKKRKSQGLGLNAVAKSNEIQGSSEVFAALHVFNDAKQALLSLGYREQEIQKALQGVKSANQSVTDLSLDQVIKGSLRELSN
jgi:Holliday junction DNA helicase RuvA